MSRQMLAWWLSICSCRPKVLGMFPAVYQPTVSHSAEHTLPSVPSICASHDVYGLVGDCVCVCVLGVKVCWKGRRAETAGREQHWLSRWKQVSQPAPGGTKLVLEKAAPENWIFPVPRREQGSLLLRSIDFPFCHFAFIKAQKLNLKLSLGHRWRPARTWTAVFRCWMKNSGQVLKWRCNGSQKSHGPARLGGVYCLLCPINKHDISRYTGTWCKL